MTSLRPLTGWGRTAATAGYVEPVRRREDAVAAIRLAGERGLIARGLGRSYGDAAQNAGGVVLDMTGLERVLAVDADARTAVVDAGVSLDTLMRTLLPFGLWVPVLPGTRQVTVGGAIAADVHGKNHHVEGSFGAHVRSLDLLTADGAVRTLGRDDPAARDLFWATVGGMGLTGVVLRATLELSGVDSAYFLVDTERAGDIDELMQRLAGGDEHYPYSVAWFDSVASGDRLGRAVITRGRSATAEELPAALRRRPLHFDAPALGRVPPGIPGGLLNRLTARVFNELWFRRAPVSRRGEVQNITTFFHPLDVVSRLEPRLRSAGLLPVPVRRPRRRRVGLPAVRGGHRRVGARLLPQRAQALRSWQPRLLSFPTAGWTLAVDLAVRPGLEALFARLDAMVLEAGGRVYLAKDSRLPAAQLRRMYPRLEEFARVRRRVDPAGMFCSDLARRLDL